MENQNTPTPTAEFDFDEWLAMGERVTHTVNLYSRMGLIADIEALEKQRVAYEPAPEGDEAMGGDTNPNAELDEKIGHLYERINESKLSFRVTGRTSAEVDTIRDTMLTECSAKIDEESAKGRAEGQKIAKRNGVTAPGDINALVRMTAGEWSQRFMNREINLRIVAESTHIIAPDGTLHTITLDRVRNLYEKLGEQQIGLLVDAAYQSKDDMPEVTVPKS